MVESTATAGAQSLSDQSRKKHGLLPPHLVIDVRLERFAWELASFSAPLASEGDLMKTVPDVPLDPIISFESVHFAPLSEKFEVTINRTKTHARCRPVKLE